MLLEFSDCNNASAIKKKVRTDFKEYIKKFLIETLGEENVSQVDNNELSVAVGEALDENGFNTEVCCNIKFIAKPFKSNLETQRPITAFDRYEAAAAFELENSIETEEEE